MNVQSQKVLDRLAGRDSARDAKLRNTVWYGRWDKLAEDILKSTEKQAAGKILRRVFNLVEECHGHHHEHIASSSEKALELVCRERGFR